MNALPKRIQRKRTKGWKMPPDTIYVGRNSNYGNWHIVGENGTASECVEKYENDIAEFRRLGGENEYQEWIGRLRGKNLACWCPLDEPCHADILLRLANDWRRNDT
jgi:hypothetical protein